MDGSNEGIDEGVFVGIDVGSIDGCDEGTIERLGCMLGRIDVEG